MAKRTASSDSRTAAAMRSVWTFFLSFLKAEACVSVRLGVPSHPIGCDNLPVRSKVGGQLVGHTGCNGRVVGLLTGSVECVRVPGPYRLPRIGCTATSIALSSTQMQHFLLRLRLCLRHQPRPLLPPDWMQNHLHQCLRCRHQLGLARRGRAPFQQPSCFFRGCHRRQNRVCRELGTMGWCSCN